MPASNKKHKWTLMFFLAGDNDLSPSMVTELKAIKDAGFQKETAVLVHFDPNEAGAPTRIFNVNKTRKERAKESRIGDDDDPFVRDMKDDIVDPKEINASAGKSSRAIKAALGKGSDKVEVGEALSLFLGFCRENFKAENYILFLVGHGLIVANDAFLPDEHPVSSLSLIDLDNILRRFAGDVQVDKSQFQLISMHSCSMSGIEVAYQLRGTANYMLATEGSSFIGSWPYRQLLKKIFNAAENEKKRGARNATNIPELIERIYDLSLFNAVDFALAGYSSDLALCSLAPAAVEGLTEPLQELVRRLKEGLKNEETEVRLTEMLILAHCRAQSYWMESYTDLYDFCKCLGELCDEGNEFQAVLKQACDAVRGKLHPDSEDFVVRSEHFGSKFQYSHGVSVYFPWLRPIEIEPEKPSQSRGVAAKRRSGSVSFKRLTDENGAPVQEGVLHRYERYAFSTELGEDSWLSFLQAYFDATMRESRSHEDQPEKGMRSRSGGKEKSIAASLPPIIKEKLGMVGVLEGPGKTNPFLEGPGKSNPFVGVGCDCPSIKNYEQEDELRIRGRRKVRNSPTPEGSKGALGAF